MMWRGDVSLQCGVRSSHSSDALERRPEPPSRRRPDLAIKPPALEAIAYAASRKTPQALPTAENSGRLLSAPCGVPPRSRARPDAATALALPLRFRRKRRPPLALPPRRLDHGPSAASIIAIGGPSHSHAPEAGAPPALSSSPGRNGRLIAVLLAVAALSSWPRARRVRRVPRVDVTLARITAETVRLIRRGIRTAMAPDAAPPRRHHRPHRQRPKDRCRRREHPQPAPSVETARAHRLRTPRGTPARTEKSGGSAPRAWFATARDTRGKVGAGALQRRSRSTAASPALPKQPPIYLECTGASDVCGALTTAFEQAFEREGLPRAARPDGAEILVNASATLLDTHQDQQYGTSFVVQTFSLELRAEAVRDGSAVSMPAARTFSFDRRFGGERAAEQGRLMAAAAVERIQTFWARRVGG